MTTCHPAVWTRTHAVAAASAAALVLLAPAAAHADSHERTVGQHRQGLRFVCNTVSATFPEGRAVGSGNCTSPVGNGPIYDSFVLADRSGEMAVFCSNVLVPSGQSDAPARIVGYQCVPIDE
ncbi:hypothetical protein [Kitasatospora sp. NPDC097691]|uniref:hypothetical protein n=1 Tax=Kitasatospora sp. NPDC097691 TaxID=3157231 RepID=UPI00332CB664